MIRSFRPVADEQHGVPRCESNTVVASSQYPACNPAVVMGSPFTSSFRAAAVLLLALSAACASPDAGPVAPRSAPLIVSLKKSLATPEKTAGLLRDTPLADDVVASAVIGVAGGSLSVPGTGFVLVVPPGAVIVPTQFRVTAFAGAAVAYDFEPHGAVFPVTVSFRQDLKKTSWAKVKDVTLVQVGYFSSTAGVDPVTGVALVDEWVNTATDITKKTLSADLPHFSGYMVSSGRTPPPPPVPNP